jgi:tryptophan-rich sensory protein
MKMPKLCIATKLSLSVIICLLAGLLGNIATESALRTWYPTLSKPFFTPPNWLFGPVWTTLYVLMGISLFLVWKEGIDKNSKFAIKLFVLQLILNVFWSYVFFGLESTLGGFIVILALWAAVFFTALKFHKISKSAGLLMVPYIVWITIAAMLNLSIFLLNP